MIVAPNGLPNNIAPFFAADLMIYPGHHFSPKSINPIQLIRDALVFAIRDYCEKNSFKNAVIGLSGGIDSAVVLCLACEALGTAHIQPIFMPGPYTSEASARDSYALCGQMNLDLIEWPITAHYEALRAHLALNNNLAKQNLQARFRGMMLMSYANEQHAIVLNTGNKSELAMGYCTQYGDLIGALAVLGDLNKTSVYALANHCFAEVIPLNIRTRAPSAELAPNQVDSDHLPPYDFLDQELDALLEYRFANAAISQAVFRQAYKRKQSPPIIRLTESSLDKDWRFPLNSYFNFEAD
jgi:NAD+ synthetase